MLLLIAGVQIGIIRFPIAHHAEQNFEPALAQTANGTGMAHPSLALVLIVDLGPGDAALKTISPQMHNVAHTFVTSPPDLNAPSLAGLIADRSEEHTSELQSLR